jgi:peptide deformylase
MAEADGQVLDDVEELDSEAEARRRLALAQIRQYPDAVLRMRAKEVTAFDDDLARLADRMARLMRDAHGIGLAATQVGVLQRLFVFQQDEDTVTALVNPTVTPRSERTEVDEEGCLSLGPIRVPVERYVEVTVEAQDVRGDPVRLELEGLPARIVQHETDHLDGVLIVNRTTDEQARREAMAVLRPRAVLAVRGR